MIDIFELKHDIKVKSLVVEIHGNLIMIKDAQNGECVKIGEIKEDV